MTNSRPTISFIPGVDLPALGMGTWYMGDDRFARKEEIAALQHGLALGLNVVDTAEMYGSGRSEDLVGEALRGRRDEAFLVTKVLPSNASRRGTVKACENSLRRLGTDYIDLYLLHWRGSHPFAQTVEAMEELIKAGKIRAWGVSNLDNADLAELEDVTGGKAYATNQILYNLVRRGPEWDLLPLLRERNVPMMAYSPVEQARLFSAGTSFDVLTNVANRNGATPAQVALAWCIRDGGVIPIPKSGQRVHVEENVKALDLTLSPEDLADLEAVFPAPTGPVPLEVL